VDLNLLTILLKENESASLDFKRDQYRFVVASDNEKSELLKDVLAFVNSWRHANAYILIGVDEQHNNAVVGVSSHFNDASLTPVPVSADLSKTTNRAPPQTKTASRWHSLVFVIPNISSL
jgi:predicted HTH transcriptional regulator